MYIIHKCIRNQSIKTNLQKTNNMILMEHLSDRTNILEAVFAKPGLVLTAPTAAVALSPTSLNPPAPFASTA